jgi:hypothetical protein
VTLSPFGIEKKKRTSSHTIDVTKSQRQNKKKEEKKEKNIPATRSHDNRRRLF